MKIYIFLIVNLIFLTHAMSAEIILPSKIEAGFNGDTNFSEIVEVVQGDQLLMRELRSMKIQLTAATTLAELVAPLRKARSEVASFKYISLRIPQQVFVEVKPGFSRSALERRLLNEMTAICTYCRFEIKSMGPQADQLIGHWELDTSTVRLQNSLTIGLLDGHGKTQWLPVSLRVFTKALVANKPLMIGAHATSEDFELKEVELNSFKETPMTSIDSAGVTMARYMPMGSVLSFGDFKKDSAAKKGQIVRVITGSDDFEISITAVAEESGQIGELIRVKSMDSNKVLSTIVTGKNEVRLQ